MEIGVAHPASFGLDEELAGLGARHPELLERERAAGLPEDGAAHVAGPARHVVPRGGGGGVGPRRCRCAEGAAEERAADPAEEGAGGGGSGHGHGLRVDQPSWSRQASDSATDYSIKIGRAHV